MLVKGGGDYYIALPFLIFELVMKAQMLHK